MSLNIDIPEKQNMIPKITVLGVGGAGGNAVNNMIRLNLSGVNFIVANTDAQALNNSKAEEKIQLGDELTKGLGAGSMPAIGEKAAGESKNEIEAAIKESNMVFITAGMGGGTGTGAAPVIARMCRELGILTVGVITKPFHFEGSYRMKAAEEGVAEIQNFVDTLIVIPNQNLFHKATEQTTFAEAFNMVDDVLYSGIKGITDLMTMPGLINLDFADIRSIMGNMGKAMMGTGESGGEKRALEAAEFAISNPLLDNSSMKGAAGVLINIAGGLDMTLFEADEAAQRIKDEVDVDANIIFGSTFDQTLDGKIRVSVVATGIDRGEAEEKASLFNREEAEQVRNIEEIEEEVVKKVEGFVPKQAISPDMLNVSNESLSEDVLFKQDSKFEDYSNDVQSHTNMESGLHFSIEEVEKESEQGSKKVVNNEINNLLQKETQKKNTGFSNLFGFFKEKYKKIDETPEAPVQVNNQKNNIEADLDISDDMLNVPTFLREKNK